MFISYSNIIILLSFLGAVMTAFFKHFYLFAIILLILLIYGVLTYSVDKFVSTN